MNATKINFLTSEYEYSHGRSPKGRGSWAFRPVGESVHNANDTSTLFWTPGSTTYAEAKKLARAHFKALNVSDVMVCS